jgi:hypothetical protein
VFGRLTAVEKTEKRKNGKVVWACSCSCGTMIEVRSTQLTHGETKSCGCLKLEMAHNNGIGGAGSLS